MLLKHMIFLTSQNSSHIFPSFILKNSFIVNCTVHSSGRVKPLALYQFLATLNRLYYS